MSRSGRLFVLSGPSGAGKTTICERLLSAPGARRVVTCTTRPPRGDEQAEEDYHFLSEEEFDQKITERGFLEHAKVHDHRYGTPRDEVEAGLREGATLLLNIDVQGAQQLRDAGVGPATFVFVEPPDLETLRQRLESRGTDDQETIERRLRTAREEMKERDRFDRVIVNGDLEQAVADGLRLLGSADSSGDDGSPPRGCAVSDVETR